MSIKKIDHKSASSPYEFYDDQKRMITFFEENPDLQQLTLSTADSQSLIQALSQPDPKLSLELGKVADLIPNLLKNEDLRMSFTWYEVLKTVPVKALYDAFFGFNAILGEKKDVIGRASNMTYSYEDSAGNEEIVDATINLDKVVPEIQAKMVRTGYGCLNLLSELAYLRLPPKLLRAILSQAYSDHELKKILAGIEDLRTQLLTVLTPPPTESEVTSDYTEWL